MKFCYLVIRFNPVWQDPFGKFGCLVLSGQETHMPSPVDPYFKWIITQIWLPDKFSWKRIIVHWREPRLQTTNRKVVWLDFYLEFLFPSAIWIDYKTLHSMNSMYHIYKGILYVLNFTILKMLLSLTVTSLQTIISSKSSLLIKDF